MMLQLLFLFVWSDALCSIMMIIILRLPILLNKRLSLAVPSMEFLCYFVILFKNGVTTAPSLSPGSDARYRSL